MVRIIKRKSFPVGKRGKLDNAPEINSFLELNVQPMKAVAFNLAKLIDRYEGNYPPNKANPDLAVRWNDQKFTV
jgi:hypothetical protein